MAFTRLVLETPALEPAPDTLNSRGFFEMGIFLRGYGAVPPGINLKAKWLEDGSVELAEMESGSSSNKRRIVIGNYPTSGEAKYSWEVMVASNVDDLF